MRMPRRFKRDLERIQNRERVLASRKRRSARDSIAEALNCCSKCGQELPRKNNQARDQQISELGLQEEILHGK